MSTHCPQRGCGSIQCPSTRVPLPSCLGPLRRVALHLAQHVVLSVGFLVAHLQSPRRFRLLSSPWCLPSARRRVGWISSAEGASRWASRRLGAEGLLAGEPKPVQSPYRKRAPLLVRTRASGAGSSWGVFLARARPRRVRRAPLRPKKVAGRFFATGVPQPGRSTPTSAPRRCRRSGGLPLAAWLGRGWPPGPGMAISPLTPEAL